MGASISTNGIPERRLPTYLPPMNPATRYYPPPPPPAPPQKLPVPPSMTTTTTTTVAATTGSRVIAFHSSSRWKAYFESSKSSNKLIVIDFTASWCGPCKLIEPFFNELASKYTDVDFVKIDVDELMICTKSLTYEGQYQRICAIQALRDVGRQFGIQTMPTFLFMKRGQEVDRIVGVKKEELHKKVDKNRLDGNTNYGYYY